MGLERLSSSQPLGALGGEADADAEERGADHAEAAVAGEHVFGGVHGVDGVAAVGEAEEDVEHERETEDGEREGAGAEELEELVFRLFKEDADGCGGGATQGLDGWGDGEGGHGGSPWEFEELSWR